MRHDWTVRAYYELTSHMETPMKKLFIAFIVSMAACLSYAATVELSAKLNNRTLGTEKTDSKTLTTTGQDYHLQVVSVTDSESEFTISTDIGSAGYVWVKNLDTSGGTNVVSIGTTNATAAAHTVVLQADQFALFPIPANQDKLYLKCTNTGGSTSAEIFVIEQ